MVIIPPKKYRKGRAKKSHAVLTLVSALYDPTEFTLTLTFNQAVSLNAFDGSQITLGDGVLNMELYTMQNDPTQPSANVVLLNLEYADSYSGTQVILNSTGASGIVVLSSGSQWTGVTDFVAEHS
jgi:hypothetical protein